MTGRMIQVTLDIIPPTRNSIPGKGHANDSSSCPVLPTPGQPLLTDTGETYRLGLRASRRSLATCNTTFVKMMISGSPLPIQYNRSRTRSLPPESYWCPDRSGGTAAISSGIDPVRHLTGCRISFQMQNPTLHLELHGVDFKAWCYISDLVSRDVGSSLP